MEVELSVVEEGSGDLEKMNVELGEGAEVVDALEAAGIDPETVLVERDGRIVPKGEEIEEGEIRVLQVISGG